jgi:uncharacterized membrane protein
VSRLFPDPGMRQAPDGTPLRRAAPRRLTGLVMVVGVLLAAACFGVAVMAELLGRAGPEGSMTDPGAVLAGLRDGRPWAFASLGTYVVILTPAAALLATAVEYAVIRDRRTVLLAVTVLLVLVASVVVGILR